MDPPTPTPPLLIPQSQTRCSLPTCTSTLPPNLTCPACGTTAYCSRLCSVSHHAAHATTCRRHTPPSSPAKTTGYSVILQSAADSLAAGKTRAALTRLAPLAQVHPDDPAVVVAYAEALLSHAEALDDPRGKGKALQDAALDLLGDLPSLPHVEGNHLGALAFHTHAAALRASRGPSASLSALEKAQSVYEAARAAGMDHPRYLRDAVDVLLGLADMAGKESAAEADLVYDALTLAADALALPAVTGCDDPKLVASFHCVYAQLLLRYDAFRKSLLLAAVSNDVVPPADLGMDEPNPDMYLANRRERERAERLQWQAMESVYDAVLPHYQAVLDSPSAAPDHATCCAVPALRAYALVHKYSKAAALAQSLLGSDLAETSAPLHTYSAHVYAAGFADLETASVLYAQGCEMAGPDFAIRAHFADAKFAAEKVQDMDRARRSYARVLALPPVHPNDPAVKAAAAADGLSAVQAASLVTNRGEGIDDERAASSAAGVGTHIRS